MELIVALVACTLVVMIPLGLLGLARLVDESPKGAGRMLAIRPVHLVLGLGALAALVVSVESPPGALALVCLLVLVLFARAWVHEFFFLMDRRDDEFAGRFDKAVWAFLLVALAPVGLWVFRSYRLSRWPDPSAEAVKGRASAADLA